MLTEYSGAKTATQNTVHQLKKQTAQAAAPYAESEAFDPVQRPRLRNLGLSVLAKNQIASSPQITAANNSLFFSFILISVIGLRIVPQCGGRMNHQKHERHEQGTPDSQDASEPKSCN